ncbi:NAD-dependent epimerase/dehydratase family protein [Sphingomonas sp. Leaf37]|uniref:NAD-dependent epimerase/dehydratase family protein n=1 Tax=Sphingomonas sp. Leaf37 TaxID=2876552 RepID=UPI001E424DC8|nr:NAD(P)-dependent oxidoreductase [Sphingomonas sp. Leaf37]
MRIAILGATSMLAADFVAYSLGKQAPYRFALFARDPDQIRAALGRRGITAFPECGRLAEFVDGEWDAVVNFVGVGDPARAAAMGADILRITREWDDRVLDYLQSHRNCRYIFFSSGAAFGMSASQPSASQSSACFNINDMTVSAFYGISKFYSEAVHRANPDMSIIDIRIFNYISQYADLNHRFLINEVIAAAKNDTTISVDANDMWRDYLGQEDLSTLVAICLAAPSGYNGAIDAYSLAPISKLQILQLFEEQFGLKYRIDGGGINATGSKSNYYSTNKIAQSLGYYPHFTSEQTVQNVAKKIISL